MDCLMANAAILEDRMIDCWYKQIQAYMVSQCLPGDASK